jgi:hypothetical protein
LNVKSGMAAPPLSAPIYVSMVALIYLLQTF